MRSLAGRYRVEQAVGHGGSAVVHSGYDRTLKRRVAIKLFSPYRPDSSAPSADVLREARAAAALNHPNVARVYDYGEATDDADQRVPYLVMEFLDGDTLADRIAADGAFAWTRAAGICADVAAALAAAHARDLVHRDVKPRNVMLTPAGVKVLDFGIAAMAGQHSFDAQGQLWGTPATLAPEQLRGEPTYPAADVYALGLLLFECLTGTRAWPGTSVGDILAARYQQRAPRLPGIAGLPRDIVRLYEACIDDDPARRPAAAEVAEILRRAAGKAPTVRPAAALTRTIPPVRRRSRSRAAITASIAVAAAFVSVIGLQVANGYATPGGREAEAAVDGAPVPRAPQPAPKPTVTSTQPVPDVPVDAERPVRRVTDTWTREATAPPQNRKPKPKPKPSSEAPSVAPTTPPAGPRPTPSDPPPTTTEPDPEPTDPPATTEPPVEPTDPPPDPEPEDPPPADGQPVQDVVLAES